MAKKPETAKAAKPEKESLPTSTERVPARPTPNLASSSKSSDVTAALDQTAPGGRFIVDGKLVNSEGDEI